ETFDLGAGEVADGTFDAAGKFVPASAPGDQRSAPSPPAHVVPPYGYAANPSARSAPASSYAAPPILPLGSAPAYGAPGGRLPAMTGGTSLQAQRGVTPPPPGIVP